MEIYLLGPLEVHRRGVVVTPSAPKLRTVLSLLAIQANTVVRTDQIIDELWEDDPPASVTTTLQTYIYQLRKLLHLATVPGVPPERTPSEQPTIRTSPHGYALTLNPDLLDVTRFERLADQGRRELDAGRVEQASRTLVLALRSWRGQALIDVDQGPVLRTEAVRLEEIRRSALERRIDADLLLGRHHELLGELTRLAAQQPTHEGFQAKLMLALYRAGRRCEALTVYQRTRTTLAKELGLDPSPELERLHRAVLAADAVLDLPRPRTTARAAPHRPRQLPPEGPTLVGRRSQLTAVLTALSKQRRQRPPVAVITGPPGSGTSALCTQVGHRADRAYPDGQLYARLLDARGHPAEPADVLAEFLRALEVPEERIPPSLNERSRLFRTCTADMRLLVVLDDLVSTEQLQPLLPSNPGCGVVATARRRLSAPQITAGVVLRPLRLSEGAQLLIDVLGEGRIKGEEAAVRDLIRLCGGLPAALHAAAARLQVRPHWRPGKLVEWLTDSTDLPSPPAQDALSLDASVQRSYLIVRPAVRAAFRTLSALEKPAFSLQDAAHELRLPPREAEALLDELAEFQLLEAEPGTGPDRLRYRFLEGIRRVGRRLPAEELGGVDIPCEPPCDTLRVEPV